MEPTNGQCHQYIIKKKHEASDLKHFKITKEKRDKLSLKSFKFHIVNKNNLDEIRNVKDFIKKYEYLGTIPQRTSYMFYTTYKGKMASALIMSTPYAFSNLFGEKSKEIEQVISRGASCSICPKNMGSWLITQAIRYCLHNTPYRVFIGYADPRANERGYIYRSLNAILVNDKAGTKYEFTDPENPTKWHSGRNFRKLGAYRRYAKKLSITWEKSWNDRGKILWDNIPFSIQQQLRNSSSSAQTKALKRKVPPKLKYIIVKGTNRSEERKLRRLLIKHNPSLLNPDGTIGLPYPKERGK